MAYAKYDPKVFQIKAMKGIIYVELTDTAKYLLFNSKWNLMISKPHQNFIVRS